MSKIKPVPTILIAGTNSLDAPWWRSNSPFGRAVRNWCRLINGKDPYYWTTRLNWVPYGRHIDWTNAARMLMWYVQAKLASPDGSSPPVNIIAHSHGGQVALIAAALGLKINCLITVCTPVRGDLNETYNVAKDNIARWIHIYSCNDKWQWLGAFGVRIAGYWKKMPYSDENHFQPGGHTRLVLDPAVWEERQWFHFLRRVPRSVWKRSAYARRRQRRDYSHREINRLAGRSRRTAS